MKGTYIVVYAILSVMLVLSALNFFALFKSVFWPYPLDYSEALILASSGSMYKSLSTYPYMITYYPPLLYLITGAFGHLLPAFRYSDPYFYVRALTLAAKLADALLIFAIANRLIGKGRFYAALAPLFFFSSQLMLLEGATYNPIFFEMIFDLLAVYMLMLGSDTKHAAYAAVLLVIASMFKQSAFVFFAALLLYMLWERKIRQSALFAAIFIGAEGIITLMLDAATAGRFLLSVYELPFITPGGIGIFVSNFYGFVAYTPIALLAIFMLVWVFHSKAKSRIIMVSLLVTGIAALSAAKFGATSLYFMQFFALACITAAAGISNAATARRGEGINFENPRVVFAFSAVILALTLLIYILYYPDTNVYQGIYGGQVPSSYKIGLLLRNVSGPILVESPNVAVAANKSILFEPSIFWVMRNRGLWNDSMIISDINSCRFSAISFPMVYNRFTLYPNLMQAITEHYQESYSGYGWLIYAPKAAC